MALIKRIESQRSFDIGGIPSTQVDDSVGRGLQRLGGAISDHASTMAALDNRRLQQQMQMEEFATNQAFLRFEDDVSADYAEKQANIDPSGAGFTDTVSGIYNARAEAFMKGVPDALKPKFAELLATSRNQWIDKAAAAEVDQRNTWYRTGITERADVLQSQVFNDPNMFDAAKQDAYRQIDASGLSPTEKIEWKRKTEEMFSLAVGEREIRDIEQDPSRFSGARERLGIRGGAVDQFVDRIIKVESGGKANAKNPNSSATGAGQFIASTWLGMVRKYRPDLMDGRTNAEILALRNDYALSREMTRRYAEENAGFLAAQGLPQTPGNIYLAHFLGPRGAAQVLKAAPGTPIEAIVGADAVKANDFLRGKSASWVVGWASRKMGDGKGAPSQIDPRYAGLTLDQRLKLADQMEAAAQRGVSAINAQQKAAYDAEKGALELGIQTGEVTSVQQIMASDMTDAHKADLIAALRSRQGDTLAVAEALAAFRDGRFSADPYSSADRKIVDGMYDVAAQQVAPEHMQVFTEDLIARSGIVPQKVHNRLRAGLESTVPSEVEAALTQADRIAQINPSILGRRDGGAEIQKKADDFRHYVNNLNLDPADAAKKIAELNDPQKQRDRKALEPAAKEFRKQIENDDIGAMFDESILGLAPNPDVGFNEAQRLGIQAEYIAIAEEQFYQVNGNPELAKNRAREEMKRLYGVTDISGRSVVMKHPPERYWPEMPGNDPYGYVRDQIADELGRFIDDDALPGWFPDEKARAAGLPAMRKEAVLNSLIVASTPETDAMIKAGQMPAYFVGYVDPNGNIQTIPGKLFVPDISGVKAERERLINREIEWAREDDVDIRMRQDTPDGGRGASLDSFLDGPTVLPTIDITPDDTPEAQLQDQRKQLFRDAQDTGVLGPN